MLSALCPVSEHWEHSDSLVFIISHKICVHIDKIPPELSFLQTEQSQLSLSSYKTCFSALISQWSVTEMKSLQRVSKDGTDVFHSVLLVKEAAERWWIQTDFCFMTNVHCHCRGFSEACYSLSWCVAGRNYGGDLALPPATQCKIRDSSIKISD